MKRSGGQLSLLLLDLDHFKQFNDTYGHASGDDALVSVAGVLRQVMKRQDDWAFRIGGEEFACLLSTDSEVDAQEIAGHLRSRIMELGITHSKSPTAGVLTISIGVAQLPDSEINTIHDLYKSADKALYEAKRSGRNRVCAGQTVAQRLRVVPDAAV